jgi:RNA polymerase sigma factor (TIGR02999 family)
MTTPVSEDISQLLAHWSDGNKAALDQLIPLVYAELRRLAHHYLRGERAGQTLQTSALVNEAYLRLVDYRNMRWQDRTHFFAVSAQLMRRILVEHARKRHAAKRGGDAIQVSLNDADAAQEQRSIDLMALDRALGELAALDERRSRIVELRYFGGLNIEETAAALALSTPTVQREWRIAKAWLHRAISSYESNDTSTAETDQ